MTEASLYLAEHVARTERSGADLVFGRTAAVSFRPQSVAKRAAKAWESENSAPYLSFPQLRQA